MMMCTAPAAGRSGVRARGAAAVVLAAGSLVLAACDIPTELPRFQPRFVVPVEGASLGVAELLPPAVTVSGDVFRVDVMPSQAQRTLGDMCEACRAAHLTVVPKPAFTYAFAVSSPLPAQVASAVITTADVQVRLRHAFGFDPLQPPGRTEDGSVSLVVRSGGRELGTAVVTGPLPPNTDVFRTITIAPGEVGEPIEVLATINSPAGGPVLVNRDAVFRLELIPGVIQASQARVMVMNRQVSIAPVQVDLTGVDEELRSRVTDGGLIMVIRNPFTVAGDFELRLRVPQTGTDLRRTIAIEHGESTRHVTLTTDEVRALLGQRVDVSATGALSGTAGAVTVTPQAEIVLDPRLDLVLEIGS